METRTATYDVVVVGGRVAGALTAVLFARKGRRVAVVDRAGFHETVAGAADLSAIAS